MKNKKSGKVIDQFEIDYSVVNAAIDDLYSWMKESPGILLSEKGIKDFLVKQNIPTMFCSDIFVSLRCKEGCSEKYSCVVFGDLEHSHNVDILFNFLNDQIEDLKDRIYYLEKKSGVS